MLFLRYKKVVEISPNSNFEPEKFLLHYSIHLLLCNCSNIKFILIPVSDLYNCK